MKVLLIQPPLSDFYHTTIRSYPLSLLLIASNISQDFKVKILNCRLGKVKKIKNEHFKELDIFYYENKISPFSLFKGYKRYGLEKKEITEIIKNFAPEVIGINSNFSAHFFEIKDLIKDIKNSFKSIKIVLGGCHPTIFPEDILKDENVDFLIRGEGETPFSLLLNSFKKNTPFEEIKGLCYKKNGKVFINEINIEKDIDFIPRRDLIDKNAYKWGGSYFSQFLTSRGCPFSCAFCGKIKTPFRKRKLESMFEEIEILERENIKFLSLEDEVLGLDEIHFKKTLELFKGKTFKLSCMNGIYLGVLKKELLKLMEEAGFVKLNLSFVDISKDLLIKEKRNFLDGFKILDEIESYPFLFEIHYIIGMPRQKVENILEMMKYLMEKRTLLAPSVYYLAPFSEEFKNYYKGEDFKYFRSSSLYSYNPNFNQKTLFTLLLLARFINYIKMKIDKFEINAFEGLIEISKDEIEKEILKKLLKEKKFYFFDEKFKIFKEEPVELEIINHFFKRFKDEKIKGYKKHKYLTI